MAVVMCAVCQMTRDSSVPTCPLCGAQASSAVPDGPRGREAASAPPQADEVGAASAGRPRTLDSAHRGGAVAWARLELPGPVVVELLPGQVLVLGRESPERVVADALDPFPDISRRHARVEVTSTDIRVVDVGSAFGTSVDGVALEGMAILGAGRHTIDLAGHAVATLTVSTDNRR